MENNNVKRMAIIGAVALGAFALMSFTNKAKAAAAISDDDAKKSADANAASAAANTNALKAKLAAEAEPANDALQAASEYYASLAQQNAAAAAAAQQQAAAAAQQQAAAAEVAQKQSNAVIIASPGSTPSADTLIVNTGTAPSATPVVVVSPPTQVNKPLPAVTFSSDPIYTSSAKTIMYDSIPAPSITTTITTTPISTAAAFAAAKYAAAGTPNPPPPPAGYLTPEGVTASQILAGINGMINSLLGVEFKQDNSNAIKVGILPKPRTRTIFPENDLFWYKIYKASY